jgi:tetratricopeptide (TPR) repeat protein
LEIERRLLGDEHIEVASTLQEMGSVYRALGRFEEAEQTLTLALGIRVNWFFVMCQLVADSFNALGTIYLDTGRFDLAKKAFQEALEKEPTDTYWRASGIEPVWARESAS